MTDETPDPDATAPDQDTTDAPLDGVAKIPAEVPEVDEQGQHSAPDADQDSAEPEQNTSGQAGWAGTDAPPAQPDPAVDPLLPGVPVVPADEPPAQPESTGQPTPEAPAPGTANDPPETHGDAVLGNAQPTVEVTATASNPDANPAQTQFPSLAGKPDIEVAERSADQDDPSSDYEKVFIVGPPIPNWEPPADDHDWHDANKAAVLNEAVNRGLHPSGEATYVGYTVHTDGVSRCLRYAVPVIPAAVDPDSSTTVVPAHSENVLNSYPDNTPVVKPPAE